jgi:hypothetical protein
MKRRTTIKCARAEIAIEWYSLANRIAQDVGQDRDIEVRLKAPCELAMNLQLVA